MKKNSIVIVDDHQMFSEALAEIIEKDTNCKILYAVRDGSALMQRLKNNEYIPELILLDMNMMDIDGYDTAIWLKEHHPEIKILVLSMNGRDEDIIKMLKVGCAGYLLKEASRQELKRGIEMVLEKGFYHSDLVANKLLQWVREDKPDSIADPFELKEREKEFLPYACSELTYREIADKMCVSERTVDNYREALFRKFEVKSRVGLALFAIKNGLVKV